MGEIKIPKSKEIDRMELRKYLNQDNKSAKNPKGGFRRKIQIKKDKNGILISSFIGE